MSARLYVCSHTNIFRIYTHLDKLYNSKVNFIYSLDLLRMYTCHKIQNKTETASRTELGKCYREPQRGQQMNIH